MAAFSETTTRGTLQRSCAWAIVWCVWAILSREHQATLALLVIATTTLVGGAAGVLEIDLRLRRRRWAYVWVIGGVLVGMTLIVVAIITFAYDLIIGSSQLRFSVRTNLALDFTFIIVHWAIARGGLAIGGRMFDRGRVEIDVLSSRSR